LAGAIGIGLPWLGRVNTFHEFPDVDPYWEVRWSGNPKRNKSAPEDKPDQLILHVTGRDPTFEVHGFILAGWVQRNFPLTDPNDSGRPAHFFPTHLLTPIDENFHVTHAWLTTPERGWHCEYCGKQYEGLVPEQLVREDAGGRDEGRSAEPEPARPLPQPRRRKARSRTPA
jgi:hypothetical protein